MKCRFAWTAALLLAVSGVALASSDPPGIAPPFHFEDVPCTHAPLSTLEDQEACLRTAFSVWVGKQSLPVTPENTTAWQQRAMAAFAATGQVLAAPQAILVVNANLHAQHIALMVARPGAPWDLIGISRVSTGQPGRRDHFLTPAGVYAYDGSILGYRAEGTRNKNGVRGLGVAGSRVWDFGWQPAQAGWTHQPDVRDIRMMLHATDPWYIEPRLGHPASKGCIHVSDGMNHLLDRLGVLDADTIQMAANGSRAWQALLPRHQTPILPGRFLIIIDAKPPPRAAAIATR